jgi:hypothetical protein
MTREVVHPGGTVVGEVVGEVVGAVVGAVVEVVASDVDEDESVLTDASLLVQDVVM